MDNGGTCRAPQEELEVALKELEEMKSKSLSAESEAYEAEEQLLKASRAADARSPRHRV